MTSQKGQEAAEFQWDLASDVISWGESASRILCVTDMGTIPSGSAFQLLVASEHALGRYRAIWEHGGRDQGDGVSYEAHYRFQPLGRRNSRQIWLEERGRWFAGEDGKPARVVGFLRPFSEERAELDRLRRLSELDELTGLLNRKALLQALDRAASDAVEAGRSSVFMLAAINNLQAINETFGFDVGDMTIAKVAERLRAKMRAGDSIGRYSSSTFGFVVHDCQAEGLQAVSRRLIEAIRATTVRCGEHDISASVSLGAVQLPQHATNALAAASAGMEALSDARQTPNKLVVYSTARIDSEGRKRTIKTAESVLAALEQQRMRVALQAIVRADTRQVAYYECLLRMLGEDGSLIPAGQFVPIAEQLGLSRMIDQRVLDLAVGLVRADPNLRISFNISSLTASDHDWLVKLHKLTGADRALTSRLMIEITETMAISNLNETAAFVDAVKDIGCTVALDDFGAGYTSFKNLKALAVDVIKLDGSFTRNLRDDPSGKVFVESMVTLAKNLRMTTVAEMVGDAESADMLAGLGVDYLQGFHFGQPQVAPLPLPIAPKRK